MYSNKDYEIIDHTADIGIRVRANSLTKVIQKSILAQSDLMNGGIEIEPRMKKEFVIKEEDKETALVSILEEVLYLFEYEKFSASECSIKYHNNEYRVKLKGKYLKEEEIKNGIEIKAVTYHQLKIKKIDDSYLVNVIFDI